MRTTRIMTAWGGEDRAFQLQIGQQRELQRLCDAGPPVILSRLAGASYRLEDVREPIRLGLIGGGMTPVEAEALVRVYVDVRPLMENTLVAQAIVMAVVVGVEEEPGEKTAGPATKPSKTRRSPTARSASRASTV